MWGPLAEQPHPGAAGPDDPPWRENAYFSCWDPAKGAAVIVHVSTSPNAEGCRARASVALGGRTAELVEPLAPLELSSESITVDLDGRVRVEGSRVSLDLRYTPRFALADYGLLDGFLAPLGDRPPISHFQRGADVEGWIEIDGERAEIVGQGLRDRTWGFRDDQRAGSSPADPSTITVEYLAGAGCLPDFTFTLMKMLKADGSTTVGGFVLGDEVRRIIGAEVTRDGVGLLAQLDVEIEDGDRLSFTAGPTRVGFWLPLGVVKKGPVLSVYDEFIPLAAGTHGAGGGVMEHGIVRRLG